MKIIFELLIVLLLPLCVFSQGLKELESIAFVNEQLIVSSVNEKSFTIVGKSDDVVVYSGRGYEGLFIYKDHTFSILFDGITNYANEIEVRTYPVRFPEFTPDKYSKLIKIDKTKVLLIKPLRELTKEVMEDIFSDIKKPQVTPIHVDYQFRSLPKKIMSNKKTQLHMVFGTSLIIAFLDKKMYCYDMKNLEIQFEADVSKIEERFSVLRLANNRIGLITESAKIYQVEKLKDDDKKHAVKFDKQLGARSLSDLKIVHTKSSDYIIQRSTSEGNNEQWKTVEKYDYIKNDNKSDKDIFNKMTIYNKIYANKEFKKTFNKSIE